MIPISWIVLQKLLQDTLVNIRSKILGKVDLTNAITLCRLTSVFNTSYSSVYVCFSTDNVNSLISTSFSAWWLFLYQKDSNVPQISTGFLCSVATLPTGSILPSSSPPPPPYMAVYYPQHGCILPPRPSKKKKENMVDKSLWLNCEPLFQKPVDTDYISGMKNNDCLLKDAFYCIFMLLIRNLGSLMSWLINWL